MAGLQLGAGIFDPGMLVGSWGRTEWPRPEAELTFEQPLAELVDGDVSDYRDDDGNPDTPAPNDDPRYDLARLADAARRYRRAPDVPRVVWYPG